MVFLVTCCYFFFFLYICYCCWVYIRFCINRTIAVRMQVLLKHSIILPVFSVDRMYVRTSYNFPFNVNVNLYLFCSVCFVNLCNHLKNCDIIKVKCYSLELLTYVQMNLFRHQHLFTLTLTLRYSHTYYSIQMQRGIKMRFIFRK